MANLSQKIIDRVESLGWSVSKNEDDTYSVFSKSTGCQCSGPYTIHFIFNVILEDDDLSPHSHAPTITLAEVFEREGIEVFCESPMEIEWKGYKLTGQCANSAIQDVKHTYEHIKGFRVI